MESYSSQFFSDLREGALKSARAVVPLVMEIVDPNSVIDVGAGMGTWLSVFVDRGIDDVLAVDGDYVDRDALEISADRFLARDLTQPFRMDRRFDMAMSLEVAEHLPPESGVDFVESLTRLAPIVLFSAAIPYQGGTGHVNEQWPEYWAELFEAKGFVPVDCIRRRIWRIDDVDWWYRQNLLVFASQEALDAHPHLKREYEAMGTQQLSLVHPTKYLYCMQWGMSLAEQNDGDKRPDVHSEQAP